MRHRCASWTIDQVDYERRYSEPFVWAVLCFMIGVLVYFALPQEPSLMALGIVGLTCLAIAYWQRHKGGRFYCLLMVLMLVVGTFAGAMHTHFWGVPIVAVQQNVNVRGTVSQVEPRANGSTRVVFDEVVLQRGQSRAAIPKRIRVSVRGKTFAPQLGEVYRFRARLGPPSGPIVPGGYDFARDLFFKGIGASGFVFGSPVKISDPVTIGLGSYIAQARLDIAQRIKSAFTYNNQPDSAGIAVALLVGERGGVSEERRQSLSTSGLAHILAISGLHMALVVTSIIFITRFLLSRSTELTLRFPIRPIAYVVGLGGGLVYFALSGASVSATRAFLMLSIMVVALAFGRKALSVRNIALALIIVLALEPVSLLGPGLQMSFIATLSLVAFAGLWIGKRFDTDQRRSPLRTIRHGAQRYLGGLVVTSVLAGASTALFAAYHFYRIAPFGLLANVAGLPIFGLVVMPFGLLGLVLMPFGLEILPFKVMGLGLEAMIDISDYVAKLSATSSSVGSLSTAPVLILTAVIILLCVLKSKLRWFAVLPIILALPLVVEHNRPDIFIAEDGKTVALVQEDGELLVSGRRSGEFEIKNWRAHLALPLKQSTYATPACDEYGCILKRGSFHIAHIKHPSAFAEDCRRADLVVTTLSAPGYCRDFAQVIDKINLRTSGAHTVRIDAQGQKKTALTEIKTAIPYFKRPWHAHYATNKNEL